jgi:hypothetical protein
MPKAWQKVRPNEAIARAINAMDWQPLSGMMADDGLPTISTPATPPA